MELFKRPGLPIQSPLISQCHDSPENSLVDKRFSSDSSGLCRIRRAVLSLRPEGWTPSDNERTGMDLVVYPGWSCVPRRMSNVGWRCSTQDTFRSRVRYRYDSSAPWHPLLGRLSKWRLPLDASFQYADHLNTPRLVADATGTTVWRWDQAEPFGNNPADENPSGLGAFDLLLRLPGQRYDKETGLHYNYFRDYDPSVGRYGESDPTGLQ